MERTRLKLARFNLDAIYEKINREHFDNFLLWPGLQFNSRLRSSAGRFIPGSRNKWHNRPPIIEIAHYLQELPNAAEAIDDTMGHEMIHYWLWERGRPYGHTPEFWAKMRAMGVSRYNTTPMLRPILYLYRCLGCTKEFPARKRLGVIACAKCCKQFANGRYDERFRLVLDRRLSRDEGMELARQKAAERAARAAAAEARY
jgi:predicted SprT family Zn-dependent metalloprotease